MPAFVRRGLFSLGTVCALGLVFSVLSATRGAAAQAATGTVTGRVLWGACLRAIPLPISPDGQPAPPMVPNPPNAQAIPGQRPVPSSGLPAGAVLVALQNSSISARTDETGHFSLDGVPAGQYFTVAAGPVANSPTAVAERPNVFVNGAQSVDIGTLSLGGESSGLTCRFVPGSDAPPDSSIVPGVAVPNTSSDVVGTDTPADGTPTP